MKNGFIVKKVKIVWRNSMIAGNPNRNCPSSI